MSMCELKINDYQAIAILWKQKIQQAPHKHNHTRTPNLTWKTLQSRGKNQETAPKNIHYEIEITTSIHSKLDIQQINLNK